MKLRNQDPGSKSSQQACMRATQSSLHKCKTVGEQDPTVSKDALNIVHELSVALASIRACTCFRSRNSHRPHRFFARDRGRNCPCCLFLLVRSSLAAALPIEDDSDMLRTESSITKHKNIKDGEQDCGISKRYQFTMRATRSSHTRVSRSSLPSSSHEVEPWYINYNDPHTRET